ncbi:hypothetical protein ACVGVM_01865 [Pseudonocardia bannensis]|uniref:Uncharacterized protein n=1 Tax=Pseudonocardia bannensis TaxID=630973 RepID=A0A848DK16_9PSEU|nr:hypothetical protein [Pseudonocardia bannensis]NMH92889.1 hypothetical protein [Pseudonocardia bannensis]
MLIAVLVAVAFACLVLGVVLAEITVTYVAFGVSLLGIAVLAFASIRKRRGARSAEVPGRLADEVGPGEPGADEQPGPPAGESGGTASSGTSVHSSPCDDAASAEEPERAAVESGADLGVEDPIQARIVHVVPGRRRYHTPECRLLNSHADEQITLEEAHEEGFSACTTCIPDGSDLVSSPVRD